MTPLYFWVSLILIFLLIEVFTSTFYGLSLSLSAAIVAICTYLFPGIFSSYIVAVCVFAVCSSVSAYILPRYIGRDTQSVQWLDVYIGQNFSIYTDTSGAHTVVLDGIVYTIDIIDSEKIWERVHIIGRNGSKFSGVYII